MSYGSEQATRLANMYMAIGAGDPDELPDQRSLTRRLTMIFAAALVVTAIPLHWAATARGDDRGAPVATVKSGKKAGEDDDDQGEDWNDDAGATGHDAAIATAQP